MALAPSPAGDGLLSPARCEQIEQALHDARCFPEESAEQRAAEAQLLQLVRPFIFQAARGAWESTFPRTYVSRADLLQDGLLRAQKLWRDFTPGQAGPGRTLYPAYVLRAVRQEFSRALAAAQVVPLTDWGRKVAARARKRAAAEGLPLYEALRAERADASTALALSSTVERVGESYAVQCADESELRREDLAEQLRAAEALEKLPRRQRLAVAGPLGLLRKDGLPIEDSRLAQRLECTVAQVRAAREEGLAALRAVLGEGPRCPLLSLSAWEYVVPVDWACPGGTTRTSRRNWDRATPSRRALRLRPAFVRMAARVRATVECACQPVWAAYGCSRRGAPRAAGTGLSTATRALACSRPARWIRSPAGGLIHA